MQGKIACANVLSDLYAMGVSDCDNMLMILGVSTQMNANEREVSTSLMIKGFNDLAKDAGTTVNGGQSVLNPWYIIGGVATSVTSSSEFIMPENAKVGDVLVLTKPIGTQIAVNAHQWLEQPKYSKFWDQIKDVISEEHVKKAYKDAMFGMARLNKTGAKLMHRFHAHAATDVTGFGIIGHAKNLAANQKDDVSFVLDSLPIYANMAAVAKASSINFKLLDGYSAETSGGLLIAMAPQDAKEFCDTFLEEDGHPAWIIGKVVKGTKDASISANPTIIEV